MLIRKAWLLLRIPSRYQYWVVFLTVLVPVATFSLIDRFIINRFFADCFIYWEAVPLIGRFIDWEATSLDGPVIWTLIIAWSFASLLAIASVISEERIIARQSIDQKVQDVRSELRQLKDDNGGRIDSLQDQVHELDRVTRYAFEGIGVAFPPRTVSGRVRFSAGTPRMRVTASVDRGSWRRHSLALDAAPA